MKSYLFAAIVPLLLLAAACKKDDKPAPTVYTWKVGTTTYRQATWSTSGSDYSFFDTSGNYLSFYFNSRPTASGAFKVVRTLTPGAQEVLVSAGTFTSGNPYLSTGLDNITATVEVADSKLRITLPEAWARPAGRDDSLKLSGTVSQIP